ncbi:hydrogenase nickel incorporation protein HypB [Azoarcus indigens]|uniref:Hydrogenase maturation factor HypB n=1 Tax=Azoarcus indigens TaxID=29545 RepID=A0A4R6DW85_9RHOO|nr:hydrogenase nickel incorporation protein HypB [Azoarcus indigens]NMG65211.1 hydrogenase nickel incorporation protein HypB [Azoarcus indigens]TDN49530.1 hydrogenase nickel incorporation protein HypB [Azoarcus indigens]
MCTVCGCGSGELRYNGQPARPAAPPKASTSVGFKPAAGAAPAAGHTPTPPPAAETHRPTASAGALHYGHGPAHAHAPGLSQAQMVKIEQDILGKNDRLAAANRDWLARRGVFALNLVSSPGSGKTTLLVETIRRLAGRLPVAVIEGDQQTEFDAERIRATGAPALQINTGKGCHLDAHMVGEAFARLAIPPRSLLLIENVGNLVCPAAFDLGEAHKVVILSVTEGEDKPLKYPDMFAAADLMLLSKTDLLPHLSFDVQRAIDFARRVNPGLRVLQLSSTSGEGFDAWLDWIADGAAAASSSAVEVAETQS